MDPPGTIPEWLRLIAAQYGERTAVVGSGTELTYTELESRSRLWARGLLRRGVGKGSRIGLWLPNGPDWVLTWAAVSRMGAVAVPLSTFFSNRELARVVRHADLQGLIFPRRFLGQDMAARLEQALPGLGDDPELFLGEAPFLRWMVALDPAGTQPIVRSGPQPGWVRRPEWITGAAESLPESVLDQAEAETHRTDPALMIYTSGSTADSKGAPHIHETITVKTRYLRQFFEMETDTRSYVGSPFFWVGGMTMSLLPILDAGGTQYCTERFDAGEVLQLIAQHRINRVVLYPHQINAILEHPDFPVADRSSLRDADPRLLAPETPRPEPDPDRLQIGLGMTETFDGYWWGRRDPGREPPLRPGERRPPPLDVVLPGVEVKVVDPAGRRVGDKERGEICIRGFGITPGLHKADRATVFDPDGFFHTGDEVEVDGDRVWFKGRLSEMIKTAGANVAPDEVSQALREIDGVAEAYVVALPDPVRGQVVAAAVVPEPGATLDATSIRQELRTLVSSFKVPAHIVFVAEDEVPWTPSHKVRLGVLREMVEKQIRAETSFGHSAETSFGHSAETSFGPAAETAAEAPAPDGRDRQNQI